MIGLGRILAEAREARGVTLEEAERDTRIARRYLLALEEEDFAVFPARAQARGFLRMYSLYLRLDAPAMLALFPQDHLADEADARFQNERIFRAEPGASEPRRRWPSLPAVGLRSPAMALVGGFAGVLLVTGLLGARCATRSERANAELALLAEDGAASVARMPDVRDDTLDAALARLDAEGIRPLVIEVPSDRIAAGLIISQSPSPGAAVLRPADATLVVSRGRQ